MKTLAPTGGWSVEEVAFRRQLVSACVGFLGFECGVPIQCCQSEHSGGDENPAGDQQRGPVSRGEDDFRGVACVFWRGGDGCRDSGEHGQTECDANLLGRVKQCRGDPCLVLAR